MPSQNIKKYIPKSAFFRNVATLMAGTTIAQAIPIAVSPILTRMYSPEDFGVFSLYMAIVATIAVISTARYELAIILPERDEDALNIVFLSLIIVITISFLTLLGVWVFNKQLVQVIGIPTISKWLYFIPVSVLLTGVYQTFSNWFNRKKQYKYLAANKVYQSFSTAITQMGLGTVKVGFSGLFFGGIVGQGIVTLLLFWKVWKEKEGRIGWLSRRRVIEQAKRYKEFPCINVLHALVDSVNANGTMFLLAYFFNSSIVGQYSLMMRVLRAPIGLIGGAMTQVFYQQASSLYNQGKDLRQAILRLIIKLGLISALPSTILFFSAPDIFALFFGEKWRVAGEYAKILVPYIFFHFIVSPLTYVPFIVNEQFKAFLFSSLGNFLYVACVCYSGYQGNIGLGLRGISFLLPIYFFMYMLWILKIANKNKRVEIE